jgi:hypothetical protein
MEAYCEEVWRLEDKFHGLELNHIGCRYNEAADELAKITSNRTTVPLNVFMKDLHQPSVNIRADGGVDGPSLDLPPEAEAPSTGAKAMQVEGSTPPANPEPDWRILYLNHLTRGDLPSDKNEARRITRRAKSFVIFGDSRELYRHSPTGVLQRCITNEEGRNLLDDLHSGACGNHTAPRTLVGNAFRQGFYWLTAVSDVVKLVRSCKGCQYYARQTHLLAHALQIVPITWPFAVWGLDLVGPLKRTTGGFTNLLVAIDKFFKWIEARPITSIRSEQAVLFFTDIVHRFGVPNCIITDNGTQFTGKKFLDFYNNHHIRVL